jgi:hypothetical protein
MNRISIVVVLLTLLLACAKPAPPLTFLSKSYTLGSFNQNSNPTWEYVSGGETVNNWTTLITLIDRQDARTVPDLDRLAQGVTDTYKSHGGRILLAKTLKDKTGAAFNYAVVAFEEPAKNRFELNFVKFGMGPNNAYIMVFGARVAKSEGKDFLNQHSTEIGRAMDNAALPDLNTLARK